MSIPVYQQIKKFLREEIRQGKYKPGDIIPSVNQLARMFFTSRNTSVRAISDLVHEGIVYTVQGKGTLVTGFRKKTKEPKSKKKSNSQDAWILILHVGLAHADLLKWQELLHECDMIPLKYSEKANQILLDLIKKSKGRGA